MFSQPSRCRWLTQAINCCAEGGAPEEVERIFTMMQEWGVRPDAVSFGAAIKACGRDWQRAAELLTRMRRELGQCDVQSCTQAVSYTHLTLPTICSV